MLICELGYSHFMRRLAVRAASGNSKQIVVDHALAVMRIEVDELVILRRADEEQQALELPLKDSNAPFENQHSSGHHQAVSVNQVEFVLAQSLWDQKNERLRF